MTRIIVRKLVWDEYNTLHIQTHKVTQQEVEVIAKNIIIHKKAKEGRYLIIGRSGSRILSVIVNRKGIGTYYPVTARDSAKKERVRVYEKENK